MFKQLPNIKPVGQTTIPARRLVLHPVTMLAFFCQTLFFFLFYSANRYSLNSPLDQFILTFAWGIIYYGAIFLFMGKCIHYLVSRNVPISFGYFIYFSIMAVLEAGFGHLFYRSEQGFSEFMWHVFSTQVALVPAIIICSFFFEKQTRNIFGYDPETVPYWSPVNRDANLWQAFLPRGKRGRLLKLQADNQYVHVTTESGTHVLRATLKSLLESIPKNDGVHLHRSIWLSKDQIKEFVYEKGNPRIVDVSGNVVPVSRSKVDLIKQLIKTTK